MSFTKWREGYEKSFDEALSDHQASTMSFIKSRKNSNITSLMPEGLEEQTLHLYTAYRNQRTNNMLVWATWSLAVFTMILSGLTIYLQYFKN